MGANRSESDAAGPDRVRLALVPAGEVVPRLCAECSRDLDALNADVRAVFCSERCRKRLQVRRRREREQDRDGAIPRGSLPVVPVEPVPWVDTRPKPLPGVDPGAQGAHPLPPELQIPGEAFWSHMCRCLLLVRHDVQYARWLWDKHSDPAYATHDGRVPARPHEDLVSLALELGWPVPRQWR
jgi:predicted nucleic acid-binding Zn ribbon protein